jgi:hypothetical protein
MNKKKGILEVIIPILRVEIGVSCAKIRVQMVEKMAKGFKS